MKTPDNMYDLNARHNAIKQQQANKKQQDYLEKLEKPSKVQHLAQERLWQR